MFRYTLRQFQFFVAAADAGSIVQAAEALHISQPSVSAALSKLEGRLGVQLLVRHHAAGVSLTPTGRRLLSDAKSLLRHAAELQRQAELAGAEISGELALGSFVTLAPAFLPALVSEFRTLHPGVSIQLAEGTQDDLLDGLRRGRFELALLYEVDLPGDIAAEPLAAFAPYVLLPAAHRLAAAAAVALEELAAEPFILLDVPPSRSYFTRLLEARGIAAKAAFSSPSLELVRGLVGRGLGYSLLVTRPFADTTYEGLPVAARPIAGPAEPGRIALARLAQVRPTRLMTAFAAFCQTWFAAHSDSVTPAKPAPAEAGGRGPILSCRRVRTRRE